MKRMKICLALLSLTLLTTACASKRPKAIKIEDNQYFAGFQALDQGDWDRAAELFQKSVDEQPEDIAPYIGLARARINTGNYKEAEGILKKALEIRPDAENALFYLGEVSQKLEDYDLESECYDKLMDLKPDDNLVKDRMIGAIWKIDDDEKRYDYSVKIYQQDDSYLQNLLWACSASQDESKMDAVLELLKDTNQYYPVKSLFDAYTLLKNGDREGAEAVLFDVENSKKLFECGKLYYGNCDGKKNKNGIGVGIQKVFGQYGAMAGSWKNGYWEGECTAWTGSIANTTSRNNGVERKGKRYEESTYAGTWREGKPEGEIFHNYRCDRIYDDEGQPHHREQENTTLYFENGGAQGETITERLYYSNYKQAWEDQGTKLYHVFLDGKPISFEIETYEGKKEVYEADMNEYGAAFYEEDPCECSYKWDE